MIIIRQAIKLSPFRFATSASNILSKFDDDFYLNNYLKSYESHGFPQATIEINNKSIKLLGVPHHGDQNRLLDDLTDLVLKNPNQKNFFVQVDPSPYLYIKRQLYKEYHKNIDPIINQVIHTNSQNIFDQLPMIPIHVEELQINFNVLDTLYQIKTNKPTTLEQKSELLSILDSTKSGYFQSAFEQLNKMKANKQPFGKEIEQITNEVQSNLSNLIQETFLYNDQSSMVDFCKLTLFQAMYMTALKGSNVYLCDLSYIYQRIYQGIMMSLNETQQVFKDACSEAIGQSNLPVSHFYQFATLHIRQQAVEYYMIYCINSFLASEENELTVILDRFHFEPMRIALLGQKGKLIDEIQQSYFHEFAFPTAEVKETDEQMIEKHAILDSLGDVALWKESCVNNPFPYLSRDYNEMNKEEQKEIMGLFYKYQSKYNMVVREADKKFKNRQ